MKKLLILSLILCCTATSTAFAAWQCRARDRFANTWISDTFGSRGAALNQAINKCQSSSRRPSSCHVAESMCWTVGEMRHQGGGDGDYGRGGRRWTCVAKDLRNAHFRGNGMRRHHAERRALESCRTNNPFALSCFVKRCSAN